jgi:hypothetical protein
VTTLSEDGLEWIVFKEVGTLGTFGEDVVEFFAPAGEELAADVHHFAFIDGIEDFGAGVEVVRDIGSHYLGIGVVNVSWFEQ